jgi:hypothetical protein
MRPGPALDPSYGGNKAHSIGLSRIAAANCHQSRPELQVVVKQNRPKGPEMSGNRME